MPFTLDPLSYPINQIILRVGMQFQIWRYHIKPYRGIEEKNARKRELVMLLELDAAVATGLITHYYFRWDYLTRTPKGIHLIPHPTVRRTPGIRRLKGLFLGSNYRYNDNSRPCPLAKSLEETPMTDPEPLQEAAFLADFKVLEPTGKGKAPQLKNRPDPKLKPALGKGKKTKKAK